MKKIRFTTVLLLALFLCLQKGNTQPELATTVIKAGILIHPESEEVLVDQLIFIADKQIIAVGKADQWMIPDSAQVIDLSSYTVFPGLMEAHTHICMALPPSNFGGNMRNFWADFLSYTTTNSTAYRALVGSATSQELLHAGFTTIRDLGNAGNYADTDVRRAIEEGLIQGPSIINAGKIIAPMGGQYIAGMRPDLLRWFSNDVDDYVGVLPPGNADLGTADYIYADTRDELKKAVRTNILHGARVIKLVVDDQIYHYTEADIRFVVTEARQAGLKVAAHCITDSGAIHAILGGVASIEHGSGMTAATLALASEKGTFLVPAGGPLKEAFDADVKIAFGTDNIRAGTANLSRSDAILSQVRKYAKAGIPSTAILRMMTTDAAELLSIDHYSGRIAKGYIADIVATRHNPYGQIETLSNVVFVMKEGRIVKSIATGDE